MGMNICLELNGDDHPDWDYSRQGHDKEFSSLLDGLESPDHPEAKGFCFGEEITVDYRDMLKLSGIEL